MSAAVVTVNKKRTAPESGCPPAKKVPVQSAPIAAAAACMSGVPGWQYPPLPMGMVPPMPYCMPGNPFFPPFMGMFPPFWLPAAAMAAASMPLVGAGATAAMPGFTGACPLQAAGAMWSMMGCAPVPPAAAPAVPGGAPERACSAASSDIAFPSTSCSNSVPTIGGISAPASPPPLAASPVSVCNGSSDLPAEDDEFATFIDSFLRSGDSELTDAAISSGLFKDAGASTSGDSSASATVPEEEACLTRSDSHNLLHLLGSDLDVPGIC